MPGEIVRDTHILYEDWVINPPTEDNPCDAEVICKSAVWQPHIKLSSK